MPDQSRIIAQRYRIDDKLGSGGMGTVWRGWDTSLQRRVAIKEVVIPAGVPHSDAQRLRDRYMREARAAARLRHPNVVAVYDMVAQPPDDRDHHGGVVWTVMELIDAHDLSAIIARQQRLTPVIVARLGLQLANALATAHNSGVLHRDVKPANVLVSLPPDTDITTGSSSARVVLTDFGIASITGDSSLTRTGQLVGSPSYLAPERLSAHGEAGPAGDLWALGCTLYAATEGRPPFYGDDPFVVMTAVTSRPVPPPLHAGALTSILRGLLDKNPASRWDADRTITALQRIVTGATSTTGTVPARTPVPATSRPIPTTRHNVPPRGEGRSAHVWAPPTRPPTGPTPSRAGHTGRVVRPRRTWMIKLGLAAAVLIAVGVSAWMTLQG